MMFPLKTQKSVSSARTIRLWYHANCEQKILFFWKWGNPVQMPRGIGWLRCHVKCCTGFTSPRTMTLKSSGSQLGVKLYACGRVGWFLSEKKTQHWLREKSRGRLCRCKQHDFLQWFPLNQRLTRLCNGPKLFWMTPAAVIRSQVCSDQTTLVDLVVYPIHWG